MPRDGAPTRQRILDSAERLVIDNGYAATTVDEVIADSRTSKGAFFHHFGSKLDLAAALVERYATADVAHLDDAVAHARASTDDPAARVLAFLDVFIDGADELMGTQSSCLYVSILTERQLVDHGTSAAIVTAVEAWRAAITELVEAAIPGGGPDPTSGVGLDPEALADHVFVTFEGAFLLCRTTGDPEHMRRQLITLRRLVAAWLRSPL